MSLLKFSAILPKAMQSGDEIVLKAKLLQGAETFCVDFVEGTCASSSEVVYQFKVNSNQVFQNWKQNGTWMMEETPEDNYIVSPDDDEFTITFNFANDEICVYSGDESRNLEHTFRNELPIYNIGSVHIWDDIKSVCEITFRYTD